MQYLVTFRCYGTWLHGDARGSIDHQRDGSGGTFVREEHRGLERAMRSQVQHPPLLLDSNMRALVEQTISEVAEYRGWTIHALAIRTNHVHVVVSANDKPEKVMNDFKSWSTRRLREADLISAQARMWSRHGSTRYLWNASSLADACRYVIESQGEDV